MLDLAVDDRERLLDFGVEVLVIEVFVPKLRERLVLLEPPGGDVIVPEPGMVLGSR